MNQHILHSNVTVGENGHLYFAGMDTVPLAEKYGTPLFLIDDERIRERCREYKIAMKKYFGEDALPLFASKALSFKEIYRIMASEGMGTDIVSSGELFTAVSAGFPMERAFFHGNNKTDFDIEYAIKNGIGYFIVDGMEELDRIDEYAGAAGIRQKILLRITPGIDPHTHKKISTGGVDSKFGSAIETGLADKITGAALSKLNIELAGFHCHIGSQIFALHSFREAAAVMVEFMARIRERYGYEIEELDLGGGLGIAYLADDAPSSIDDFAEVTCTAVRDLCERHGLTLPRLLVEPGRSLVANAGVTLYTVGILKTLPGIRKYVAVDGGMSDNIRTALYHADYEPTIANKASQPREEIVTLCGKHCESGDAVVVDMPLQKADVGDIVCVFGTGAYNMTMASNYNGQPRPAVVFVRDGVSRVVTRRETYEDLYQRDL